MDSKQKLEQKRIFKECYGRPIWKWDWGKVKLLSAQFLESLCLLAGIPHSGNKAKKISRLQAAGTVRRVLHYCNYDRYRIAAFPKKALVNLAKLVGAIHYLNKYAIAVSLINWGEACKHKGKMCLESARKQRFN